MRRSILALSAIASLSGCAVHDGNKPGEAPLWYPAFVVRDANTTQQWGGQDIYGNQTGRVDQTKQPAIGGPGSAQPVNPPDSGGRTNGNFNDPSHFYVAGQNNPQPATSAQPAAEGLRPPGSATVYPTRGNAAQSVGSPTLYPPTGTFRTDGPTLYPNGASGEKGFTGK